MKGGLNITPNRARFMGMGLYKRMYKHMKYKDNKCHKKLNIVLRKIFENMANEIIESDDGLYMEGLGYFYVFMTPTPNMKRKNVCAKRSDLVHLGGRRYYISFEPVGDKTPLMGFMLDHRENKKLRERLHQRLREGKRYKHYLSSFKKVKAISV